MCKHYEINQKNKAYVEEQNAFEQKTQCNRFFAGLEITVTQHRDSPVGLFVRLREPQPAVLTDVSGVDLEKEAMLRSGTGSSTMSP